jgi:hypothetical protein
MRLAKTTLLAIALFFSVSVKAAEPAEQSDKSFEQEVRSVDYAIKYFMKACPGKPIMKNPEIREEMANAIVGASRAHGVPPLLLTMLVYNESTFETDAKGALGEVGLTQVHGLAKRECSLDTAGGQLDCGSRWLAQWYQDCGNSWERALTGYASGKCVSPSSRTQDKIAYRMRQWARVAKESEELLKTDFGG